MGNPMMRKALRCFVACCMFACVLSTIPGTSAMSQHSTEGYVPETDPLVQRKLEQWQDRRLGLFMHWGIYSVWGIEASWSYCAEDNGWNPREHGRSDNYEHYKEDYRDLRRVFDPVRFDPDRWARAAKEAGLRYVVFTTKHHDGFCMFDTETTPFRVTAPDCPFHTNPRADITRAVFDAFRAEGFMIGVYFSKPDWNSENYWWPYFGTADRHVNYDPAKYPERWERFTTFTARQIEELMTRYGPIDILWLDGGWVRPLENIPERFAWWAKKNDWNQDIGMDRIAAMARHHQPGLIIVDRTVAGRFENYVTPEGSVPEDPIAVPWETCLMMGSDQWSWKEGQVFMPVRSLIHTLVDNVAKGGNLLLNIGPAPDGTWPDDAYDRLRGIGTWMAVNGEAIYATRAVAPFKEGRLRFTQNPVTGAVYALHLADTGEALPPATLRIRGLRPAPGASVTMLGMDDPVQWSADDSGCILTLPPSALRTPPCEHAWVIRIGAVERKKDMPHQ